MDATGDVRDDPSIGGVRFYDLVPGDAIWNADQRLVAFIFSVEQDAGFRKLKYIMSVSEFRSLNCRAEERSTPFWVKL
jgi:hypothetical protein